MVGLLDHSTPEQRKEAICKVLEALLAGGDHSTPEQRKEAICRNRIGDCWLDHSTPEQRKEAMTSDGS